MSPDVLYQDSHLLVCEKPAGLLTQPAPGREDCLLRRLEAALEGPVYLVHRLDRGTGGLMVFARSREAAARLSEAVRRRDFEKEYLCVTQGVPPRSAAVLEDLLYWDAARGRSFPVTRPRRGVKAASLEYRLLEERQGLALLRVRLHTGRTHQIRVQLASRRLPLLGDRRYGGPPTASGETALWSWRLAFDHPVTGAPLAFTLPPPRQDPWALFTPPPEAPDHLPPGP